ncbi:MAG: M28 family peptidase [Chitinophagaceae bacterium]
MRIIVYTVLLSIQGIVCFSQGRSEKYAVSITAADLQKHLAIVAGPEMEGRETATPGQKKAAAYIESQFSSFGLKPGNNGSYQQHFSLIEDTLVSGTIIIGQHILALGTDFMMSASLNENDSVHADRLVFAGYGISDSLYDDYKNLDVKGAVIMLSSGEPKQGNSFLLTGTRFPSAWSSMRKKIEAAITKGAVGVLVVSPGIVYIDSGNAVQIKKSGTYLPLKEVKNSINVANISHKAFRQLFGLKYGDSLLTKLGRAEKCGSGDYRIVNEKVSFTYREMKYEAGTSSNVVALIEGSDKKEEYVFLTAHYDHIGKRGNIIYFGADDDGSGTVSLIEMAEAFAKAKSEGNGPRRTIVLMAVSGEEKGLWGSRYYADYPVFPLEKTTVNLNIDMVGRIDPKRGYGDSLNYVYVIGDDKLSTDLKKISESVNKRYTKLELDYKYNDPKDPERIFYRSDHFNFARKGVPILFYFNGTHADYHRPTDTIEKINFSLMEKRIRLVFHTAWKIANRNGMLKRDIPLQ